MANSKAKKSTHKKQTKKTKAGKSNDVVKIDPKKQYEIAEVGPIYLSWGKKRVKNSKGRFVKEYYLKKNSKHLIWVKWTDPFQDESEKNDEFWTKWSAEEQSILEGPELKKRVAQVLKDKVVWPWINDQDENAAKNKQILLREGFKEWKAKNKADGKGANGKWQLKNSATINTESEDSESDSTSATDDAGEEDEEEDEV
jgi:hypothetical protein